MRKPSALAHRHELNDGNTMIVREVRVVGELVSIGAKPVRDLKIQHRGYGKKLMKKAENVSVEDFSAKKLAVTSGIGIRDWFYELGYKLDGVYVSKLLKS